MGACLLGALMALGPTSALSQISLISAASEAPGKLVARLSVDGAAAPQAREFTLRLDKSITLPASKVASVPAAAGSAALLICLDRSGSMGAPAIAAMQDVLVRMLVPREGEARLPLTVAIVAFGTRAHHLLALTSDPTLIAQALARLSVERERDGKTRLHDAIAGAAAELRASDASWKRVLVVSDGNDEGSALSQATLIQRLQAAPAITVDAIGFGALAAAASGSLSTLAGVTGGRFAIASTRADLASTLGQMIRQSVPKPQFDVSFAYTPATDGRKAEGPVVWYRPQGGEALPLALGRDIAAAAPGSYSSSASSELSTTSNAVSDAAASSVAGGLSPFGFAARRVPLAAWIVLALLLLGAVAYFALRRARREPNTPPLQPLPPLPPLPPSPPSPPTTPGLDATRIGDPSPYEPPAEFPPFEPAPPLAAGRRTVIAHRWPLPGDGRVIAVLAAVGGAAKGRKFRVTAAQTRVGAAPDNDMVLEGDSFVSGHHALLRAEANALYVSDLDSRNGSELNSAKFKGLTRALSPGDRVTFGRTSFDVHTADETERVAASHYEPRVE